MKSATKLASVLNKRRPKGYRWAGLLGDFDGNITSDRPGEVYVRLRQAGAGYALGSFPVRGGIRQYYNLPVTVEQDPLSGEQFVVGVDETGLQYGIDSGNDPPPATYLETHAATHEWRAEADDQLQWLHTLQIYSLRVQPTSTAQTVYVQPGAFYADGAYHWLQNGVTVDLSSYYPVSSYKWVLIYIDATRTVDVADTGALDLQSLAEAPNGTYAIAAVKLTFGTSIAWLTDVVDLRFMPQNPGFTFTSLSDTPEDYSGAAEYLVRVNADEDALEFILPTAALDGIVLMAATWSVYEKTDAGLAAALAAAVSGDAILLPPGEYTADITIPENVSVMGLPGVSMSGMVTLSADSRMDSVIVSRAVASGVAFGVYADLEAGQVAYLSHCTVDVQSDGIAGVAGVYVVGTGLVDMKDCLVGSNGGGWARGILLEHDYPVGALEGYDADYSTTVAEDEIISGYHKIPPGGLYETRILRVYPQLTGTDYLYFYVEYRGNACSDTDWGDEATPLQITCDADYGGLSAAYDDEVQFLQDGAWASSYTYANRIYVDVDCLPVNERVYCRIKRTVANPGAYAQFTVTAYLGRTLTNGNLSVSALWHQNDFDGVRLVDSVIRAASFDLHAVAGVIAVKDSQYDNLQTSGTIEPRQGDRGVWDVVNFDTFHANDIDVDYGDGEETYRHLPDAYTGIADGHNSTLNVPLSNSSYRWRAASATTAAARGLGSLTHEPTGVSEPGTLSFDDGTRTLTLTVSSWMEYYIRGQQFYRVVDATVVIPDTEGLHFITFNTSDTLVSSMTPWGFDDEACFVATVYWNGTTGVIGNEQHGLVMDWATHDWMHHTVGTRYRSGLGADLSDPTAIDVAAGVIYDEDMEIVIDAQTTCRVFYRDTALGAGLFNFTAEQAGYVHTVSTVLQRDNSGTLADVTLNSYVAYWIFATNDIDVPVWALVGQREDILLANARSNNTYESLDLASLPFAEMKLLYRVILRRTAGSPGGEYIEAQDLRAVSNLPDGFYVPTSHNSLMDRDAPDAHPADAIATDTTNFDGGLSAADTDVQAALETIDDLLGGLSGTLMLDDGANWRVTLTFTNGVLTAQTVGASTSAGASWT